MRGARVKPENEAFHRAVASGEVDWSLRNHELADIYGATISSIRNLRVKMKARNVKPGRNRKTYNPNTIDWSQPYPVIANQLGISNDEIVRLRTPRGSMQLKALVVPSIRPDTLFVPYHYGHAQAINQLTNAAVDPTVKIPEYKACAATIEKLSTAEPLPNTGCYTTNFTAENAPKMFPYVVGETKGK